MKEHLDILKDSLIQNTYQDIKSIKIQGATNVALATTNTTIDWLKANQHRLKQYSNKEIINITIAIIKHLAYARPNEPLAVNALRYFLFYSQDLVDSPLNIVSGIQNILEQYLALIQDSKKELIKWALPLLVPTSILFTHCHSSTAEKVIIESNKLKPKTVIATETRPLYQGRITARNLTKHNVQTIMIVDSASAYFISDTSYLDVDAVLLGADQILSNGATVNKVGSFSISLSSHVFKKPLYIVSPSLKFDPTTDTKHLQIELRPAKEIWKSAPKELKIINPAFELIPPQFITGFITELGVLKPHELEPAVKEAYPWITTKIN